MICVNFHLVYEILVSCNFSDVVNAGYRDKSKHTDCHALTHNISGRRHNNLRYWTPMSTTTTDDDGNCVKNFCQSLLK